MTQTKRGRKPAAPVHAGTGHVCGECARGEWNTENRNWKKEVFFGYCERATFARTPDGRGVFLDNTPACEIFQAGAKRNGGVL